MKTTLKENQLMIPDMLCKMDDRIQYIESLVIRLSIDVESLREKSENEY